jgi:hypothetical protein
VRAYRVEVPARARHSQPSQARWEGKRGRQGIAGGAACTQEGRRGQKQNNTAEAVAARAKCCWHLRLTHRSVTRPHIFPSGLAQRSSKICSTKNLERPYGLVTPTPTGDASVMGGVPDPYTVADDEKISCRHPWDSSACHGQHVACLREGRKRQAGPLSRAFSFSLRFIACAAHAFSS